METQPEMKLGDEPKRNERRRPPGNGEPDPLIGSPYEQLPEYFVDHRDGAIVQENQPCYYIAGDCFLGSGREATLFEESAIVVTTQIPNEQMHPLNRAAALCVLRWRERLPVSSAPIEIGDIAEAAQYLASDPEVLKLSRAEWQGAVVRMASELKLRRNDRGVNDMPLTAHNFARGGKPTAPPLLNAKIAELAQRYPGETRFATAVPQYGPGAQTRRATPTPFTPQGR